MAYYNGLDEDVFGGANPHFLSATKPRRNSSRQSIHGRKSTASLRGTSLLNNQIEDDDAVSGRHSLAHELAAALMPEPNIGSKLLAEEFGLEFDEGAEGIDEPVHQHAINGLELERADGTNVLNELEAQDTSDSTASPLSSEAEPLPNEARSSSGSEHSTPSKSPKQPDQDPLMVLSRELETTDKFLSHLRHLDSDTSSFNSQPPLERMASDMIRRINDTVRDRESQVRELLECEREFRKISGEVGGNDVLGELDALEEVDGLVDSSTTHEPARVDSKHLEPVQEEADRSMSWNDWETDPDHLHLSVDQDRVPEPESPSSFRDSFAIPPPSTVQGPVTISKTLPHLADMRVLTSSLVSSLTSISEHAQVNGAANTEAGRKIRALKNKLGGWRMDWDSAERSRARIENWESGIIGEGDFRLASSGTKIDARKFVEGHLRAFELVLADANMKTKAILARS